MSLSKLYFGVRLNSNPAQNHVQLFVYLMMLQKSERASFTFIFQNQNLDIPKKRDKISLFLDNVNILLLAIIAKGGLCCLL